ncbi:MAG: chromate transporter [Alphaproteobacteria bacterium]|nr:chromate transporter [Alphaproteobacteria bacterium]
MSQSQPAVRLDQIFWAFCGIGAASFGGGITGWIHREIVHKRGWLSDEDMLSGIALAQIVPGANVTNTCVYVGNRLRGFPGALAALIGLMTVPFWATIVVYSLWDQISSIPILQAGVDGVAAAAVGLNLRLAFVGARRSARQVTGFVIMLATFIAIGLLKWPILPVLFVLAPVSIALSWPRGGADA